MSKQHRKMQDPLTVPGNENSIIGAGASVVGHCKMDGSVGIEGSVEGSLESEKTVTVGEDGVVVGDVVAGDALIAGRVRGSLKIASRLELRAPSDVGGDIDCRRLLIEEGATLNATIRVGSQRSQPSSSPP